MRSVLFWLVVVTAGAGAFMHYGNQIPQIKDWAIFQQPKSAPIIPDLAQAKVTDSGGPVAIVSPLSELMKGAQAEKSDDNPNAGTAPSQPHELVASDHASASPSGSVTILHRSFPLNSGVNYSFEIPPHAATPKLRGNFLSAPAKSSQPADGNAEISFLLMNQDQYDNLRHGQIGDAVLSIDSSHSQDISASLAPTYKDPAKYYLVFRNVQHEGRKKVQANFRVDF